MPPEEDQVTGNWGNMHRENVVKFGWVVLRYESEHRQTDWDAYHNTTLPHRAESLSDHTNILKSAN